jgi:hypothetical protein
MPVQLEAPNRRTIAQASLIEPLNPQKKQSAARKPAKKRMNATSLFPVWRSNPRREGLFRRKDKAKLANEGNKARQGVARTPNITRVACETLHPIING